MNEEQPEIREAPGPDFTEWGAAIGQGRGGDLVPQVSPLPGAAPPTADAPEASSVPPSAPVTHPRVIRAARHLSLGEVRLRIPPVAGKSAVQELEGRSLMDLRLVPPSVYLLGGFQEEVTGEITDFMPRRVPAGILCGHELSLGGHVNYTVRPRNVTVQVEVEIFIEQTTGSVQFGDSREHKKSLGKVMKEGTSHLGLVRFDKMASLKCGKDKEGRCVFDGEWWASSPRVNASVTLTYNQQRLDQETYELGFVHCMRKSGLAHWELLAPSSIRCGRDDQVAFVIHYLAVQGESQPARVELELEAKSIWVGSRWERVAVKTISGSDLQTGTVSQTYRLNVIAKCSAGCDLSFFEVIANREVERWTGSGERRYDRGGGDVRGTVRSDGEFGGRREAFIDCRARD